MEREKSGTIGWFGIIAGVVAWDALAPETLSEAVDRALDSRGRFIAIGSIAITAAHLLNVLPPQVDPIHLAAEHFGINHK